MVDSFGEMGESFVCLGREMVFPLGVSSLGTSVSLICLLMWSCPACFANLLSESSSVADLLSESLLSFPDSCWVSSTSKAWILVNECNSLGNPVSESCAI